MASPTGVVAGLVNFGNTCYANALLQALASCEAYYEYTQFLYKTFPIPLEHANSTQHSEKWRANMPLSRAVACCLERLQPSYHTAPPLASALEVLHTIGQHDRRLFNGFGDQQDVGEVLDCLVNASRTELHAWGRKYLHGAHAWKLKENPLQEQAPRMMRNTHAGLRSLLPSEMHTFTIHQIQSVGGFDGLLAHRLECCRCGHEFDVQLNPFTSLMLPISNVQADFHEFTVSDDVTLESCLRDFFQTKRQGPIRCPKCSLYCTLSSKTDLSCSTSEDRTSGSSVAPSSTDEEINNCHKNYPGLSHLLLKEDKRDETPTGGVVYRCCASFDYKEFQNNTVRSPKPNTDNKEAVIKQVLSSAENSRFNEAMIKTCAKKLQEVDIPWTDADSHVYATTSIAKSPKILAISLQRKIFDGTTYRKIQGRVRYPMNLNLASFMTFRSIHGTRYKLRAVLVHHGNETSGHYLTVRSIPSPDKRSLQWILTSDDKVYPITENAALGLEASMLFYERCTMAELSTGSDASCFIDL